jgi:hypothetical protein
MLLADHPTSFGGNVLRRPAQIDGIQAKTGEWACLVFRPSSLPSSRDLRQFCAAFNPALVWRSGQDHLENEQAGSANITTPASANNSPDFRWSCVAILAHPPR